MPEDVPTISSARLAAGDVSRHTFMTVRRGFDPQEVRSFLDLVARELQAWEQRDLDLRRQLSDVEERARHPVLDEATLTTALGQQTAQVLRSAHEESRRLVEAAQADAATLVREAKRHADDAQVQAESTAAERIAEAELAGSAIRQHAQQEADAAAQASQAGSESLLAEARDRGRHMIEQAQQARRRVLTDMTQRRRALHVQIEQLRAARDELAGSVLALRGATDRVLTDLARADDKARAAAADVARRSPSAPPLGDDELGAPASTGEGEPLVETTSDEDVASPGPEPAPLAAEAPEMAAAPSEAPEPEPADVTAPNEAPAVDALFARLRQARGAEAAPTEVVAAAERGSGAHPDDVTPAHGVRVLGPADEPSPPYDQQSGPEVSGGDVDGALAPSPDGALVEARAAVLDPIVTQLTRRLKRALQDDQNHLLDRIRSASPKSTNGVLLAEEDQLAPFVAAGAPLQDAAEAGRRFAVDQGVAESARGSLDTRPIAEEMARAIVTPLRRRLADSDQGVEGIALDEAAERVSAAYREWRGERVERLVGDVAVHAFSAGTIAAIGVGGSLRWVPAGPDPACADCDDNALGGAVSAGTEFPTGHRHPPAHAGCRCLVAPTPG